LTGTPLNISNFIYVIKFGNMYLLIIVLIQGNWEDNIKMNLQEVGGGRGDWMELAQDRNR
jgi:hypothetical protein